jgi:hypothetical protein
MGEDYSLHDITNCGLAIGPNKAASLRSLVNGVHHVFVCSKGFIKFTCRKECLASFLMGSETQGFEIPAEELDVALAYEKHDACNIISTHHSEILVDLNEF